jgi:hypothetical protein
LVTTSAVVGSERQGSERQPSEAGSDDQPVLPAVQASAVPTNLPIDLPTSPRDPPRAAADPTLADERVLIDGARVALSRGRPSEALRLSEQHEAKFPDGALSEERDFLRVGALGDLGRADEAREDARFFLAKYPRSNSRGTMQALLTAAPTISTPTLEPAAVSSSDPTPQDSADPVVPPVDPSFDPNAHGAY